MSVNLGKYGGIPIRLHWSFSLLLVGVIVGISIQSDLQTGLLYGIGIIALFLSVIIHELFHSFTARYYGYDTEEIVLYPLGGMSKIEEIPTNPKQEFLIAFLGPVSNFIIAGIVFGLSFLIEPLDFVLLGREFSTLVNYYILLNIGLGLFNLLIPAIPMDGGRLLRSVLAMNMPFPRATRIAVSVSKVLAIIMGIVGFFFDPWLLFIAFFIYIAGSSELEESLTRYILEDVDIRQVMTKNVKSVDKGITVEELLKRMLEEGHTGYLVEDDLTRKVGLVTLSDVQKVDPDLRNQVVVEEIMVPNIRMISINETAKEALSQMKQHEIGRILVEEEGEIKGIVTRSDIIKYVKIMGVKKQFEPDQSSPTKEIQEAVPT